MRYTFSVRLSRSTYTRSVAMISSRVFSRCIARRSAFARAFAASAVSTSPFSVGDHGSSPFSSASITLPLGVAAAVLEAIACGGGGGGGASDAELSRLLRGPSAVDVRWRTIAT